MSFGKQYDIGDIVKVLERIETSIDKITPGDYGYRLTLIENEIKALKKEISYSNSKLSDIKSVLDFIENNTNQ